MMKTRTLKRRQNAAVRLDRRMREQCKAKGLDPDKWRTYTLQWSRADVLDMMRAGARR